MESILTNKITVLLLEAVANKSMDKISAMELIARGMEIMDTFPNLSGKEKKERLMKVLYKVAAGADGILGTEDDILPKECIETLQLVLEKNILEDFITVISDTANGKFNIHKVIELTQTTTNICLPLLSKCFTKPPATKEKNTT